jgi:hypothetical protein
VVLHHAEDDQVSLADIAAAPGLGDEVDRFGRVADEDALSFGVGVDEGGDKAARRLVPLRGGFGKSVDAAVDVGIEMAIVVVERVDHSGRLLGAGGAVEVNQRLGVGGRSGQEREVVPNRGGV